MFFAKALEIDPEYSPGQNGMGDTYTYEIAVLGTHLSLFLISQYLILSICILNS